MTQSQIFLYSCLSFILGILINSIFLMPQTFLLGLLIFGIFPIATFWNHKKAVAAGFCLIFLVLGIWRHQEVLSGIPQTQERNINFVGIVVEEPDVRENYTRLKTKEAKPLSLEGRILVTTDRYPEYQYGDKLKITGKLEPPPVFDEFNYRDYLKKDGVFAVMSWPKIELLDSGLGNPLMTALFSFKNEFKKSVRKFISPPQVGILEALFFGDEGGISNDWKNKLNLTGTRHIAAVSGMNITIISSLILSFFLALGFWRKQAFYFSVILLALYVLMVGAPASAVRAGIMGGILLCSQYLGRLSSAGRAVIFAATLMLFLNPLLLRFDIGFQLSFLAILGIIYLQPSMAKWLKRLPDPKLFPLRATLSATLAAQVFTLPILIYNFGYVPIFSPIANILIVPFLAPITIIIFAFGLASIILWPLGYILSWPVWLSLTYITSIIDGFSKLHFARLVLENLHWAWLIIAYLILGFITWRLNESQKLWRA